MKILADENIDRPIVEKLRSKDFDVKYIEEEHKGVEDREVLETAESEDRIIVTFDRDFLEPGESHPGIIRITRPDRYEVIVNLVEDLANTFSSEDFKNTVVEVSPSDYRQ